MRYFGHLRPDSEMTQYSGTRSKEGAETCRRKLRTSGSSKRPVPSTGILAIGQVRIKNRDEMKGLISRDLRTSI
jgi:hypothetical protein